MSTPTLKILAGFGSPGGSSPWGNLIGDASGDLVGTASYGGGSGDGVVFGIANTPSGFITNPLVTFNGANGAYPYGGLVADAAGNLFGTTLSGGLFGEGTVFEIARTATGYASAPTTLVNFNSVVGVNPRASLTIDAAGDLFGTTTSGGSAGDGTVFEIVKNATGYASVPTTLVNFTGANGSYPVAGLISDAAGNLYGTTQVGGANGYGTVFEVAKTPFGYSPAPITLVSFNKSNGADPAAKLVMDSNGDLFGTTVSGGSSNAGTIFEIAKAATGYVATPATIVNFNGSNGSSPAGGLLVDVAGNLFGTTQNGGSSYGGTVFEIGKTSTGYASDPTILANFNYSNGDYPSADLAVDPAGNLFGTTAYGGASGGGVLFEVTDSGYVTQLSNDTGPPPVTPTSPLPPSHTVTGSGPHATASFQGLASQYKIDYTGNGNATVTDSVSSRDGTTISVNNEVLQFADKPYFIESGTGADIARLYSAGLGRMPDTNGLFNWQDLYSSNVSSSAKALGVYYSLAQTSGGFNGSLSIADGIIDSKEFSQKYGSLSDPDFVTQLYQNVLDRNPNSSELNDWLSNMTPGNPSGTTYTRAMVLVGFAESAENITKTSSWMTDTSKAG